MNDIERDLGVTKDTEFSNVLKTLEMPPVPLTYEECTGNNQPTDPHIVKHLKWL
jgi:hypothetical protein